MTWLQAQIFQFNFTQYKIAKLVIEQHLFLQPFPVSGITNFHKLLEKTVINFDKENISNNFQT